MQELLQTLVSVPLVEFDETRCVFGNEAHFNYYNNYLHLEGSNTIVSDLDDTFNETLVRWLCGCSNDNDSNESSRKLFETYVNQLLKN
ncbi:hypothetical protein Indivirus_2_41 [Indivirus ILV1]|uniref:Uncharacterized protein n=1 Tax=Indivirus ILV1 TaxID=1977633 RepID=A0A1V0SD75_9VIRU|nr:hypothetical protein Indivirus_2_41 [Indivirus ILV1]